MLTLLGLAFYLRRPATELEVGSAAYTAPVVLASQRSAKVSVAPLPADTLRPGIVRFALRQLGTPYLYAGGSPATGFDCSGFLQYVYGHFGVATPHSTALLISAGRPVPRAQAQPGDLIVFTGTAAGSTTPGHAGIVISAPGETPLRFVHASSARRESGVKISQVENSGYERRFMQVRRVLGAGNLAGAPGKPLPPSAVASRPAGAVVALPAAPVTPVTVPTPLLPAKVAPVAVRPRRHAAATHTLRAKTKAATNSPAVRHSAGKASARKAVKATAPKGTPAYRKKSAAQKTAKPATRPRAPHR